MKSTKLILCLAAVAAATLATSCRTKTGDDVGSVAGFLGALGMSEDLRNVDAAIDVFKALYRDGIIFCEVGLLLSGIGVCLSKQKGDL